MNTMSAPVRFTMGVEKVTVTVLAPTAGLMSPESSSQSCNNAARAPTAGLPAPFGTIGTVAPPAANAVTVGRTSCACG